jgi:hypothetical protein
VPETGSHPETAVQHPGSKLEPGDSGRPCSTPGGRRRSRLPCQLCPPCKNAPSNAAGPCAIARHLGDAERLTIAQIAQRLGRSPATVKSYFSDPTGEKAKVVKRRYQGAHRNCGAPTSARNGKGDAYHYCKTCHPGAIHARWTRARVRDAMRAWQQRYGTRPTSDDWSRTHANRRGGDAVARLADGEWPAPGTVTDLYGTWAAAHTDAFA